MIIELVFLATFIWLAIIGTSKVITAIKEYNSKISIVAYVSGSILSIIWVIVLTFRLLVGC